HTRHDTIARTLRAHGHPDTLAQLATNSMLTTLTHATLHLPGTDRPDTPDRSDRADGPDGLDGLDGSDGLDGLDGEHLDDLIAVVNGHPRIALHVIVPADALGIGHPICATCATNLHPHVGGDHDADGG